MNREISLKAILSLLVLSLVISMLFPCMSFAEETPVAASDEEQLVEEEIASEEPVVEEAFAEGPNLEESDLSIYEAPEIPQVIINTVNGDGNTIQKADGYVDTEIIVNEEKQIQGSGKIKVRGNSTALAEKKPFTIKFDSKTNLLGMGKAKKWALLANCYDPTLIRNALAFDTAENLGLQYTPNYKFVELTVDGVFKGSYLLTELVESGSSRVDVESDDTKSSYGGDFIIEYEERRVSEGEFYITSPVYGKRFVLHEPEEAKPETLELINSELLELENAIKSNDLTQIEKKLDVESFVNMFLMFEVFKNVDCGFSSVYFYYKSGKLYAGPVWDFDISCGNANPSEYTNYCNGKNSEDSYYGNWAKKTPWLKELIENKDFEELIRERYLEKQDCFKQLYIEGGEIDKLIAEYGSSFERNFSEAGWDVGKVYSNLTRIPDASYNENVEFLRTWLEKRVVWMHRNFGLCSKCLKYHPAKKATAERIGRKKYYECSFCHKYYLDKSAQQETSWSKLTIPRVKASPSKEPEGSSSATSQTKTFNSKLILKSLKVNKKTISVSWSSYGDDPRGYQIQYSLNSSFKNAKIRRINNASKKQKSINGLKKNKKYYVRVRAYSIESGKYVYSKWSNTKTIRTKAK